MAARSKKTTYKNKGKKKQSKQNPLAKDILLLGIVVLSQMQKFVVSFNSLNLTDISSFSQSVGKSTNGRPITAYCFGRCDPSFPSVLLFISNDS